MPTQADTAKVKLHAERLHVDRQEMLGVGVTVTTTTSTHEHAVDELLVDHSVVVERVARGVFVDEAPQVQNLDDRVIIPIFEEVLVTEKRLFLKEEIHVLRVRSERRHQETVLLREEHALVERSTAETGGTHHNPVKEMTMASHTIVAIYDTRAHADLAIADLTAAGVPASSIQHYADDNLSNTAMSDTDLTEGRPAGGFWAWLSGESESTEHHALYDQSIRSGRVIVTVIADATNIDKISRILEEHAPIEIDERAGGFGEAVGAADHASSSPRATASFDSAERGASPAATGGTREEVLSLAEESLQVGKRAVDAGATRVRRYTVERPVEEQVRLRDETVNVYRRPVSGVSVVAGDAFTDKTVEMRQTSEEAVVEKSTHVVEEVVLQKDVRDRVETIHDTLRKEEIEVTGPNGTSAVSKPAAA